MFAMNVKEGLLAVIVLVIATTKAGEILTLDEAKSFYNERLRFDYCGVGGEAHLERGENLGCLLQVLIKTKADLICKEKKFYELLKSFEVAAIRDDFQDDGVSHKIGSSLKSLKKQTSTVSGWDAMVSSVEYSILRIISSGSNTLNPSLIDSLLPESLFEEHIKRIGSPNRDAVHKAFKNMIIVAMALDDWKRNSGSFPSDLSALKLEDKWRIGIDGAEIVYEMNNGVWQLFSPGGRGGKNIGKFNEYVPVMYAPGIRFWPQSSCLWLSSDYSEKRRRLYEHGKLYDFSSPCACKLENGGIYRQ